MMFIPMLADDINKYYRHTYVKFKETGDTLYYIRDVNHRLIRGTDQEGTEFELYLSDDHPYEVDYVLPNKSFFQLAKSACLLQRIPAKQYRRGLCNENTRITRIGKTGNLVSMDLSFDVLKAFVGKQTFPSLSTVLIQRAKPISVALSSRFAYVPENGMLFADLTPVAQINKKEKTIVMLHNIFRPEIVELTKNTDLEFV
jgi:hypothetical protein